MKSVIQSQVISFQILKIKPTYDGFFCLEELSKYCFVV